MLYSKFYILNSRYRGQSLLSIVFLVGGIVVLMAVTLAALTISFLNSTYGFQAAERAQSVALAGVEDALLRLVRNKDFVPSPNPYTLSIGSDSATVTVTQNSPSVNEVAITSTATVLFRTRTVKAAAARDSTTGLVTLVSWQQT